MILLQLQATLVQSFPRQVAERSPVALALIQLFQAALNRLAGHLLQPRIDGGLDRQPQRVEFVGPEFLVERAVHAVDGLGCAVDARAALRNHGNGLLGQLARRLFIDVLQLGHLPEHVGLAFLGRLGVLVGRQPRRRLQHARQQSRLGHVNFAHGLAEVETRRLLHAVAAVAEVHLVQVESEDFILGELLRDPARQDDLLHLAPQGLLGREQHLLDHLLRDGRGALGEFSAQQVLEESARHALVVQALVLEKVGILGGQHGLNQHLGQLGIGHQGPVFRADLAHQVAVAIEHARDLRRMVVSDAAQTGEIGIAAEIVEDGPQREGAQRERREQEKQPAQDAQTPRPGLAAPAPPRVRGRGVQFLRIARRPIERQDVIDRVEAIRARPAVALGHPKVSVV